MRSKIFFPGLNGLRAIAAIGVVLSHIGHRLDNFNLPEYSWDLALYGVTIFFSLSGFLITYILLLEKKEAETIQVKKFYIRRALRIWPLYFLYLAIALIVIYSENKNLLPGSLAYYVLMAANVPFIFNSFLPYLDHYWSLAVEEQFYLFWPWLVKKSNRLIIILGSIITGMLLLKFIFRYIEIKTGNSIPYTFINVTRFQCMAIGALGAYLYYLHNHSFLSMCKIKFIQVSAWVGIALVAANRFHFTTIFDHELVAAIIVVLIINQIDNSTTIISLEKPILNFLGKISFGIYVYHPLIILLIINVLSPFIKEQGYFTKYLLVFSLIPGLTIIIAWLSYYFFESRFLRLKMKYRTIHSSDSKN